MKRRDLIASAVTVPPILLTGCANLVTPEPTSGPADAQITVLFDAFGNAPGLVRDWGYAAFVEFDGRRILFDTGNNGDILAQNARSLGVDLGRLDMVVMSHRHGDHMGGLAHVLSVNPKATIYAPKDAFGVYGSDLPGSFYRKNDALAPQQRYYGGKPPAVMRFGTAWPGADFRLIDKTTQLAPGVHVISLVSDKPGTLELRELTLALATPQGVVLVVGCSHPGIERIVEAATKIDPRVHLIAGGLHLVVSKDEEIAKIVDILLNTYNVAHVAPGHCTGEPSFEAMSKAFAARYLYAGVGTRLTLGATPRILASPGAGQPQHAAVRDNDLLGYRALAAANDQRRRRLFAELTPADLPDGNYLGQWRRSLTGCC